MKRIVMVLMVAALVALAVMGSASAKGVDKASPDLFGGCGGLNNAVDKGKEGKGPEAAGRVKFTDIIVTCHPDTLPPGQEPAPPTP